MPLTAIVSNNEFHVKFKKRFGGHPASFPILANPSSAYTVPFIRTETSLNISMEPVVTDGISENITWLKPLQYHVDYGLTLGTGSGFIGILAEDGSSIQAEDGNFIVAEQTDDVAYPLYRAGLASRNVFYVSEFNST